MKKSLIMLGSFLLSSVLSGQAQPGTAARLFLTHYMFTAKDNVVGQVRLTTQEAIRTVVLSGKDASGFTVDKEHRLLGRSVGKDKNTGRYALTVTATTASGQQISQSFTIIEDHFIHNKVIAHRGAWKNTGAPENSIAALEHAIGLRCEGSEFDVHMSADSLPVINHDASIQGISIARTPSRELLALKLTNGEPMPTLEQYIQAGLDQLNTKLILEIKASELGKEYSLALTRKIVALVEKLQAQAWVDYISFDYDVCLEVMRLAPYARVAYLKGDKTPAELAADHFYGLDYHFNVLKKNPDWVTRAKQHTLTVNVWTANDKSLLEDLLQQQVDFITTNEPELLLSLVK
ncbi:glycerophosphodiester phosphodiesterase [Dawidia soli]|nr:glycerophosphodiester phosphodiesterase family protein [Dawidia soli]